MINDANIRDLEQIVCNKLQIDHDLIYRRSRSHEIVLARIFIFIFLRKYSAMTLTQIGQRYGLLYCTISYHINKMWNLLDVDRKIALLYEEIDSELKHKLN